MKGRVWRRHVSSGALDKALDVGAGPAVQHDLVAAVADQQPGRRVAGGVPAGRLSAWLVSDERSELRRELRVLSAARGLQPSVGAVSIADLVIEPRPVAHTSHPTWGYLLRLPMASAARAPEIWAFPAWAAGVDLMFADAAGWNQPIRFAGGTGGHMSALQVAQQARDHQVARLVFAHIGRPALRAIDAGHCLPYGERDKPGRTYQLPPRR